MTLRDSKDLNNGKKNLGGISVVTISVAGIITTIVMRARTVIKKGARATSKFAKALAKLGKKAAPVIGGLLNLTAKLLSLGADVVGFLSKKLWLLAVAIAYALYEKKLLNKITMNRGAELKPGYKKTSMIEVKGKRSFIVSSLLKTQVTPEDIYYVSIPALNPNQCIIPDTLALSSFKFANSNTKSWFLNNLRKTSYRQIKY